MRTPVFKKTTRWLSLAVGVLLSSILLTACGENSPSILNTYGPVASSESFVFWVILIIATLVFIFVEGWLVLSIFRFRERPGQATPRQIHGNLKVEILWTVIPMIILFVTLFYTIRGLFEVAPSAQSQQTGKTINVEAVGHQWWWEFYYKDYKITTADTMVIPADAVIHVDLFSNNVIHSFWVPALTGKTDLIPGHQNEKWFKADSNAVGKTFTGLCAEYCGTQHGNMRFDVKVTNANDFQTWISTQQQAAAAPDKNSMAGKGAELFQANCQSCHGIVGVNLKTNGGEGFGYDDPMKACNVPGQTCLVGPNLTHFGSRHLIAGGVLDWNVASCDPNAPDLFEKCNLAKWLKDPGAIKPGN
ncbi:MAG: cytochrome c oxidase subunit II, partial [Ktedonobacteraceae bacterium]|nr:cytochrome c oxidase subunit II [Ktedonobacteraceae bacterium]